MARIPRKFQLGAVATKNQENGIIDIPHTAILQHSSISDLVHDFNATWGTDPVAVALPVCNADGLLFPVEGLTKKMSPGSKNFKGSPNNFAGLVREIAAKKLNIYLTIDPTLPFLDSRPMQIIDIVGDTARQLCIGNEQTQIVVGAILGTGIDIVIAELTKAHLTGNQSKLAGIGLDLVNLWPMGGQDKRVEMTCFCPACERWFRTDPKITSDLVSKFKTFPNPWNLALKVTTSGISPISEISYKHRPIDIVGLSKLKGFDTAFTSLNDAQLEEQAETLITYINLRHDQVIKSCKKMFDEALGGLADDEDTFVSEMASNLSRILLLEGCSLSWTSGVLLERLDTPEAEDFDELWYDIRAETPSLKHVKTRAYMSARSRYYYDAFFDLAASAVNPNVRAATGLAYLSKNQVAEKLKQRLQQALACMTEGESALSAIPELETTQSNGRIGYVGVALNKYIGDSFIGGLNIADGLGKEGDKDESQLMNLLVQQLSLKGDSAS